MNDQATPQTEEVVSAEASPRARRYLSPSEQAENTRRRHRLMMLLIRTLFLVLLVTVTLLPFVGALTETEEFTIWDYLIPIGLMFAYGALVVIIDAAMPNKRLASLFGIYLGIIAGLVGALAVGALLDLVAKSWDLTTNKTWLAYLGLAKLAIGITMCYLAVSIVLTTKDDFRLVIPYVEFAKQVRGIRPLLTDTSVLIDGRIDTLGQTGFLDAPLIVPQFVIDELQALADSSDKLKRARGRRGLTLVSKLQSNPYVDISIDNSDLPKQSVDHMLLQMAGQQNLRILTTDYNLNKVAQIHGVTVLNLNDLTNAVKSQAIPGESLIVDIVKHGEGASQGVGYMPDGTMVVVEDAAPHVGKQVVLTVTNSLQTSAGRMIFGTFKELAGGIATNFDGENHAGQMAKAATNQPRMTARPERVEESDARRNPRR